MCHTGQKSPEVYFKLNNLPHQLTQINTLLLKSNIINLTKFDTLFMYNLFWTLDTNVSGQPILTCR